MVYLMRLIAYCSFRYGASNTMAAALANAILEDYGINSADNRADAIGPSKVGYERKRQRAKRRKEQLHAQEEVSSVYFDGKKTATRVMMRNETTGKLGVNSNTEQIISFNITIILNFILADDLRRILLQASPHIVTICSCGFIFPLFIFQVNGVNRSFLKTTMLS